MVRQVISLDQNNIVCSTSLDCSDSSDQGEDALGRAVGPTTSDLGDVGNKGAAGGSLAGVVSPHKRQIVSPPGLRLAVDSQSDVDRRQVREL